MSLFLYYPELKPLLSHLLRVVVFLLNHPRDFLKLQKKSLRTFVKYHEFKNLRKIPWVSKPSLNIMGLKASVKYHKSKNLRKIS